MTIHLSNDTSYEGVLVVRNETLYGMERGFRLWWLNEDTDCMVPDEGLCTSNAFPREGWAIAHGIARYGVKARRIAG